jgi:hypothetical protein
LRPEIVCELLVAPAPGKLELVSSSGEPTRDVLVSAARVLVSAARVLVSAARVLVSAAREISGAIIRHAAAPACSSLRSSSGR